MSDVKIKDSRKGGRGGQTDRQTLPLRTVAGLELSLGVFCSEPHHAGKCLFSDKLLAKPPCRARFT